MVRHEIRPPGYTPKLRRRLWYAGDGSVRKVQWQRNCYSNPDGNKIGGWKAIDTRLDSDIADTLMEEGGFSHSEADDIIEEGSPL